MDAREDPRGATDPDRGAAGTSGVRVGFIGGGNVLGAYLRVLDLLIPKGLACEGPVHARDRSAWDDLRRRRPGIRLVATADGVWSSDVQVVVVITPPATHAEIALEALSRGKHVVVEKPIGMSRAEAEPVVEEADRAGLHLLAAPFVHLSPTFRELWTRVSRGEIGTVHSARGLYGNAGVTWASWYHEGGVGPIADLAIYNLKSLTCLLGPIREVTAVDAVAVPARTVAGRTIERPDPDVLHLIARHDGGAISSIVASQAIQRYRRPGLELYGTEGTANLLGDDWDPTGLEIWRNDDGAWSTSDPIDPTWSWADGLREAVLSIVESRRPLTSTAQDLHLAEVIDATRQAARQGGTVEVASSFTPMDLSIDLDQHHYVHDHTRPPEEQ
jgi:predicted dehydrogenase